jgi:pimeloyl-ACP methyl ester carboxylesterase
VLNHYFNDADIAHYATLYVEPDHLRAGLELCRASPRNGKFNAAQYSVIDVPWYGPQGKNLFFEKIGSRIARDLRAHGCKNVKSEIIKDSGHWMMIEQPEALAELIERYASL